MRNYRCTGRRVEITATAAYSAGDVVVMGKGIGIAVNDIANGAVGVVQVKEVFELVGCGGAWAQGTQLFWDAVNKWITASGETAAKLVMTQSGAMMASSGQTAIFAGRAFKAVAAGAVLAQVDVNNNPMIAAF